MFAFGDLASVVDAPRCVVGDLGDCGDVDGVVQLSIAVTVQAVLVARRGRRRDRCGAVVTGEVSGVFEAGDVAGIMEAAGPDGDVEVLAMGVKGGAGSSAPGEPPTFLLARQFAASSGLPARFAFTSERPVASGPSGHGCVFAYSHETMVLPSLFSRRTFSPLLLRFFQYTPRYGTPG